MDDFERGFERKFDDDQSAVLNTALTGLSNMVDSVAHASFIAIGQSLDPPPAFVQWRLFLVMHVTTFVALQSCGVEPTVETVNSFHAHMTAFLRSLAERHRLDQEGMSDFGSWSNE